MARIARFLRRSNCDLSMLRGDGTGTRAKSSRGNSLGRETRKSLIGGQFARFPRITPVKRPWHSRSAEGSPFQSRCRPAVPNPGWSLLTMSDETSKLIRERCGSDGCKLLCNAPTLSNSCCVPGYSLLATEGGHGINGSRAPRREKARRDSYCQ
jgi:hypothetical protein